MRSVVHNRADSVDALRVASVGAQVLQARISRTAWLTVRVPWEYRCANIGDEVAGGALLGALAGAGRRGAGTRGSRDVGPSRRSETSIAVSVAFTLDGVAAQAAGDGQ